MIEELKLLKEKREQLDVLKLKNKDLELGYHATQEFQNWSANQGNMEIVKEQITQLEFQIKEEALGVSRQTGFAERDFGKVQIKRFTVVEILDELAAIKWAGEFAPKTLKLTKDFDGIAKTLELPFVNVNIEYRAQIASDLSDLDKSIEEKFNAAHNSGDAT